MKFELEESKAQSSKRNCLILQIAAALGWVMLLVAFQPLRARVGPSGYHLVKTIPIGGDGGWDYCVVDSDARRIYVSHSTHVVVLDADSNAVVGDIPDTPGVHGIALAPDLGRGFISNGRGNSVTIFDLKTLKPISTVPIEGKNPDAIYYDAASKRVFTFNGGSANATVLNATDGTVVGNFPVGGRPEFAAGAGDGRIFLNIEDKSELVQIDAQKLTVVHRWSVAPCKEPSGLAMDTQNNRLFAVCGNKMMAVVNAQTGKVIATPKIDEDPDAAGFDPASQMAFSSNGGSGTLTVIHEDSPDKFSFIENVPTKKYARTMAIDFKTHNIYLPIAEFGASTASGERRPPMKANSFGLLVVSK
jgi:DNA-binding beta-propeller fold protein YncE